MQLEQKMDEMEKVMKELEQRYVCVYLILCVLKYSSMKLIFVCP